jgi:hypothetical protein
MFMPSIISSSLRVEKSETWGSHLKEIRLTGGMGNINKHFQHVIIWVRFICNDFSSRLSIMIAVHRSSVKFDGKNFLQSNLVVCRKCKDDHTVQEYRNSSFSIIHIRQNEFGNESVIIFKRHQLINNAESTTQNEGLFISK